MNNNQPLMNLVLRAVALAMGVIVIVLSILKTADPGSLIIFLGIGLSWHADWI